MACADNSFAPSESSKSDTAVGILLFGDTGNHLNYPREWDYDHPFYTDEEWLAWEVKKWVAEGRDPKDLKTPPITRSPVTGNVVPETGLHLVSKSMKKYCNTHSDCKMGIMTGDNIYPEGATLGVDGLKDADRFDDILNIPFGNLSDKYQPFISYVTLGNHDWGSSREGGFAQIQYLEDHESFYMDGPFYSVKPPAANGKIELFVIDSTILLAREPIYKAELNPDGSEKYTEELEPFLYHVEPISDEELQMVQWLETALKSSTAEWKFVVSHYPLWSAGRSKFQETKVLRELILPPVCRYADAFLSGHAHSMEIHVDNCQTVLGKPAKYPLVNIVSGGGSKQRILVDDFIDQQKLKYPQMQTVWAKGLMWGFAYLSVAKDTATVSILHVKPSKLKYSQGISENIFEYQFNRRSHLTPSIE